MKLFRTILLIFATLSMVICTLASPVSAESPPPRPSDRIIAAVPVDFPPTYYRDPETGKSAGFAIDVMNEVARRAGLQVEYVFGQQWDEILTMLQNGKADVVPNLTIDDNRKKRFAFTRVVETLPISYIARNLQNVSGPASGMKVGVMQESVAHNFLVSRTDITLVSYKSLQHLLFDLLSGQLDMVLTATPNIMKLAAEAGVEKKIRVLEPPVKEGLRGMALRSSDTELLSRLNKAIDEFTGSDAYREIYLKWWGKPAPFWSVGRIFAVALAMLAVTILVMGVWRYLTVVRLNSERMKIEEERLENLLFIESLLKHSPVGIRVFDGQSGGCIMVNQAAVEIAGGDTGSMLRQNFRELDSWRECGLQELAEAVLEDGGPRKVEIEMHTSFGKQVSVAYIVSRFPVREKPHLLVIGRDISDEKRLAEENRKIEAQMLHVQKLESLGVLAGGIAHDFNNILLAVLGNAELALRRLPPESPARDNLLRIEQAAQRAADLARQMLAYSGKGHFVIEPLDINALIKEMSHILEVSISKKAFMRFNLAHNLPLFLVDATQIRQIIMNLVINASEAIGDRSGIISITTGAKECDQGYLSEMWLGDTMDEGLYVYFEIADTGCGMDKETLSRIFDPFFTTKFTGRGLGMAAVLGIVRGHKGAIKVYSEPGKGTSFKVLLPAMRNSSAGSLRESQLIKPLMGTGTVLLVDDEETIRALGKDMLQDLGFTVLTAENGLVALELFKVHTDEIVCVMLDLTMPRMDGEQTFHELRRINPDVPIIMSSGYNEQEVTQRFVGKGLAGFIQKPYKLTELGLKLREVIGGGSEA